MYIRKVKRENGRKKQSTICCFFAATILFILSPTAYFSLREEKYAKDALGGGRFRFLPPPRPPLIETTKGGACELPPIGYPHRAHTFRGDPRTLEHLSGFAA